jgi:hypothetical protein
MTVQAGHARTRRPEPLSCWDRDAARLLALLEDTPNCALTIDDMRERGISAPAQVIYELQLAGYDIERLSVHASSRGPLGYRLLSATPRIDGRAPAPDGTTSDEPRRRTGSPRDGLQ